SLGFGEGTLECAQNCLEFDTSGCGASVFCGDNKIDGTDVCDGSDLGGKECVDFGFEDGNLKCMSNCSGFDTSECGKSMNCGNDKIDTGEVCDGSELNGKTCEDEGFEQGDLKCSADCKTFDKSECFTPCTPECGDRICGPDPVCGEPCGECTGDFELCSDEGKCEKNCELDPFTDDRSVDVNLETATVSGEITLNGSTPANNTKEYNDTASRGSIGFINKQTGQGYYISIGSSGKAAFSAKLFKGTYDVVFNPNNADYQNVFPSLNMNLQSELVVDKDTAKNFDLETATVSGKITINGKTMTNNTKQYYETESRGTIRFTNAESASSVSVSIGSSGEAAYSFNLYKGTYSATFSPNNEDYQNSVPNISMNLDQNVEITSTVTKNFNLDTVTISGKVTINGAAMANNTKQYYETESRATVYIANVESGSTTNVSLGSSGEAAFSKKIFKGKYNFTMNPNNVDNQNAIPGINMILEKEVDVSADMTRNFNLETINLSGSVKLNGATMPNNTKQYYETESRGSIYIKNDESGDGMTLSLGSSGVAAYSSKVYKGTYTFTMNPNSADSQNVLPDMNIILEKKVSANSDTKKDFNVETAIFSGKVTLNGSTMANNTKQYYEAESRGSLGFKNKESGDHSSTTLGSTGEASYSITLFKGTYDITLWPNNSDYQDVLPAIDLVLENNVVLESNITKNFNPETVNVTGSVKLNGATMPNNTKQYYETESRGFIIFRNKSSVDTMSVSVGSSGVAAFSFKLFKGSYDVDFSSNNDDNQNVLPDQNIKVYKGCFDYSAGCSLDMENITGTWEFVPEGAYWQPVTFYLTQNGEELTGNYDSYNKSGTIEPGTRKGNYIKFQFDPYYDMIVEGTIVSGCVVLGRFDTIGYSGSNYDSDFVGYRVP
ncbi:MAG TPA: hypothetical protein VLJ60_04880, partial [bacterium]|nr:hypothetical protein [bacterium]